MRAPNLVNVTLGSKCLLQLVGLGQLLIACGSTHWFVEGDARSRAAMNLCLSPDILAQVIFIKLLKSYLEKTKYYIKFDDILNLRYLTYKGTCN